MLTSVSLRRAGSLRTVSRFRNRAGQVVMNNIAEFQTAEKILPSHVVSESAERDNLRRLMIGLVAVLICIGVQMVQSASLTSRPSE